MRILHCLAQLPTRTGSGVYYRNLIGEIRKQRGWEQAGLFGLNAKNRTSYLKLDHTYPVQFESEALPFPIAGMSDEMPYPSTVYSEMTPEMLEQWKGAFRTRLLEIKDNFDPDIIICHHLWMLCTLVLEIFPDIPVIGISHGTDLRQAKQNPWLAQEHVGSLRTLHKVLALSLSDKEDLCQYFDLCDEKIVVTGGAYDPTVFYSCQSKARSQVKSPNDVIESDECEEPIRLIYAGKMTDSKGVFELVEAYAKVRRIYPNLSLDLVGRVDKETKKKIEQLSGDDPTINLFDVETQAVLAAHMRRCDLFVFPSYYEGMGLIAIEALASGLRLVSNCLPGLREQLGEELIHDPAISWVEMPELENFDEIAAEARPNYIESLADAIYHQVQCLRLRQRETCFPYKKIAECSWERLSERIIRIIEEI